jgi:DNA polymerase-3 subunit gamma/tau
MVKKKKSKRIKLPIPKIWGKVKITNELSVPKLKQKAPIQSRLEKEDSIPATRKIKIVSRQASQGNLSLKKLLNPNQGREIEVKTEIKTEPFTQGELVDKWRKFAYSIKMRDLDLYSTLSTNDPILKEDWIIDFIICNSTQEADINNKRVDLLNYLRKQFNNTVLDLNLIIDKSKTPKGIFTEKEKYKKLVEKNPKIDQLRKKFGLSF